MVKAKRFRELCLALAGTSEAPHFDRAAFRTERRIFATLAADGRNANLRLSPEQQDAVTGARPDAFTTIPNGWGRQGWTTVDLTSIDVAALRDALGWAHELSLAPTAARRPRKR